MSVRAFNTLSEDPTGYVLINLDHISCVEEITSMISVADSKGKLSPMKDVACTIKLIDGSKIVVNHTMSSVADILKATF